MSSFPPALRIWLPRAVIVLAIALLCLGIVTSAYAAQIMDEILAQAGVGPLALGLLLIVVALIMEWNTIVNLTNLENVPLATIERKHPRLPSIREVVIALILSGLLGIFLAQFLLSMFAGKYVPNQPSLTEYTQPPEVIRLHNAQ